MVMTVSKDPDWLTYLQFFKEPVRLDGSGYYSDRIGSVAYVVRALTKTYRVRKRTVSKNIM
jgi:hypothetical protein